MFEGNIVLVQDLWHGTNRRDVSAGTHLDDRLGPIVVDSDRVGTAHSSHGDAFDLSIADVLAERIVGPLIIEVAGESQSNFREVVALLHLIGVTNVVNGDRPDLVWHGASTERKGRLLADIPRVRGFLGYRAVRWWI